MEKMFVKEEDITKFELCARIMKEFLEKKNSGAPENLFAKYV
jgi:hypothetical protein